MQLKRLDIGQLKITAKPVKYIVPGIYDRNMKKGKFAKQMGMQVKLAKSVEVC